MEQVLDALPDTPQQLGAATTDHCLRNAAFEGEPPGPLNCQWRTDRYVVFDGDLRAAAEEWGKALNSNQWVSSEESFPPEWREYRNPRTHDRLVIRMVQDGSEVPRLVAAPRFEGAEEYKRERRDFTGQKEAAQAVAEGRRVARISLVHAYYRQDGQPPFEPQWW
ncbi:hypothetical protein ABZ920_04435 [Streptomyces sp. NPDC046831]|uniref:hypothetical protein n=1 Tax=Streptomyces sp. NPDC046831 TaxID=3154805 RepID=UPI0033DDD77E